MKKENIYKVLYIVAILFVVAFGIRVGFDYVNYDQMNTSAPFYVFIIERVLELLIPGIIIFIVARILKNEYTKQ